MATPPVVARLRTTDLIENFLHLAQSSVYMLSLAPTGNVVDYVQKKKGVTWKEVGGNINLMCESTQMPGSSLATHDQRSDFMGVSEKFAYRRMYPEQFSCSFYVDHDYKILHFFEGWMDFIAGKSAGNRGTTDDYKQIRNGFRMNYPDNYRSQIHLTKFEKDTKVDDIRFYHYTMIGAFPLSIDPIEVSYGGSELLKLNVNFSMVRYTVEPISELETTIKEIVPKVSTAKLPPLSDVKPDLPTPTNNSFLPLGNDFSPTGQTNINTEMSGFVPSSINSGLA